ncbi:MAG: UDP-N-acetylmuramoyl-tripeptide--D-alanyl-D-alanine ligase [Candidatus Margulisbacteria bacterium]|nr:UDP-N-acetylmuramoyl-tripeptide--D-alanyl-D-alanine ligase [Candidatus Margulisiibacteriota bacterium]
MAYSIDTRTLKPGDIFIPIKGKNFDGHAFAEEAKRKGASKILDVDLGEFAATHRQKFNIPIIAVTGSSGKTTVKDMLASVLSAKYRVLKNEENQNNEVGVPLTLLKLEQEHQIAIVEMAMRGKGEIEYLTRITQPTHALITNIGWAHIGLLKSRESIALAKSEIFLKGIHVYLNQNDEFYDFLKKEAEQKECLVKSFGSDSFIMQNEAAITTVAKDFGLSAEEINKGLELFKPSSNRMQFIKKNKDILIINDAYNANPDSMRYALEILKTKGNGQKIAVLGDMLELGDYAVAEHQKLPVDDFIVITVGELAKNIERSESTFHLMNNQEAAQQILKLIKPGATILVKGSRSMKMEEIIKILQEKIV